MNGRVRNAPGFNPVAAERELPRWYRPTAGGTVVATIAASASASFVTQVQSGYHFIMRRITAGFDQNDWSFNVTLTGYGSKSLGEGLVRGADHFFGFPDIAAVAARRWSYGYDFLPAVFVPANSNIVIDVTNGTAGVLNISFALHGMEQRVAAVA